jgi:hypothetical protein
MGLFSIFLGARTFKGDLWGGRHPGQLQPVDGVSGWSLDAPAKAEIDRILREIITDQVGPEFMAPPTRSAAE